MSARPMLRFRLKSVFVLILGISIGYALNQRTLQLLTGVPPSETYLTSLPVYRIEPPDVLNVQVFGQSNESPVVSEEQMVYPDGTIYLQGYGKVVVVGKTIEEVKRAVEAVVTERIASPRVMVDVSGFNSKVYYVITRTAAGDNVFRLPITGRDTALDAITQVGQLSSADATEMWIARPARNGAGTAKKLPIEWSKVASGDSTTTNYQLMPGDRLFIAEKPGSTTTNRR